MMKKIRNIKQLERELHRLRQKEKKLEYEIHRSWQEIKKDLRPQKVAREIAWKWLTSSFNGHGAGKIFKLFD